MTRKQATYYLLAELFTASVFLQIFEDTKWITVTVTRSGPSGRRSEMRMVLDRSNTGIVGSDPARNMDACPRYSVFCCPAQVEPLRWADPSSKGV